MKNQFLLAFNEICKEKNLPPDIVIDALQTALVSAFRRDNGVSNSQEVEAELDPRTGEVRILAQKEVTEDIFDHRTEIVIEEARQYKPDVELGDLIMADSTPANFGRIAAQTAKQVILQRVREAERDHLFDEFSGREGEIVTGTVQSTSGGNITIGLGRTEAVLPRGQQVPRERYKAHDKIRIYILEVRRTSRGPQIFVSRSHRNLLRRLLELEVPEIYNGQVDIKSIAREAGARSKVAVQAMQPGVDPVGACVGMRGVRIQSIVRELNDEKIDVIEWDEDPTNFIAKALSPARVSQVFLDDDPINGRTATVIVPDDQLSLAIGREGQNARLAAKLTGWRIDIKSLTEAGRDSLNLLTNPLADPAIVRDRTLQALVRDVIAKKEAGRPITAEDYGYINRLVVGVEGRIISSRASTHDAFRRERENVRKRVPAPFWEMNLEELDLPMSIHTVLTESGFETVGDVAYQFELDPEAFLKLNNFVEDGLQNISDRIEALTAVTDIPEIEEEDEEETSILDSLFADEPDTLDFGDDFDLDMGELVGVVAASQSAEPLEELEYIPDPLFEIDESLLVPDDETEEKEDVSVLDDLSQSLVDIVEETRSTDDDKPTVLVRRIRRDNEKDEEETDDTTSKARNLVFDERAGRVISKRKRKRSRRKQEWSDEDDF